MYLHPVSVVLCDNRNSPIMIMLLIITIITIALCMYEVHQSIIIVLFITCHPVPSRFAVSRMYVKIATLVSNFSTKATFLSQARLARAWLLEIALSTNICSLCVYVCVCVSVCVSTPEAINN